MMETSGMISDTISSFPFADFLNFVKELQIDVNDALLGIRIE